MTFGEPHYSCFVSDRQVVKWVTHYRKIETERERESDLYSTIYNNFIQLSFMCNLNILNQIIRPINLFYSFLFCFIKLLIKKSSITLDAHSLD